MRVAYVAGAILAFGLGLQPASAQLLGGAIGGGGALGGSLGGSLGGTLGGVTGNVGGSLGAQGGLDARGPDASRLDLGGDILERTRDASGNTVTIVRNNRGRLFAVTQNARGRIISRSEVVASQLQRLPPPVTVEPRVAIAPPVVDIRRREAVIASGIAVLPPREADVYMDRQVVELRGELAGTGVEVSRRGDQVVLLLPADVTFAFDKSDIRPKFYPVLDAVSRTLRKYPSTYVDVTGHTDAIGTEAYNQRLSERRAASVSRYLEAHGAAPQRIDAEGRGKDEPIASNATIAGRAANRRVEIELRPVTG